MLVEEKIINSIFSSGSTGVKKPQIKKEYPSVDVEKMLDKLTRNGEIMVAKKGNSYHYWHKDNYFKYLLESDPKYKYVFDILKTLQDSFQGLSESINKQVEKLDSRMILLMESLVISTEKGLKESVLSPDKVVNIENFKHDFDSSIYKNSDSIGWVTLSTIRNDLCSKYDISEKKFYECTEQLISKNLDNYELSSGGNEGILLRGLMHGFVRCL